MSFKWGIIGTGNIANKFCKDLNLYRPNSITAVLSRDFKKAQNFANTHNIFKAYDSLENFLNDTKIDIVYIATPHSSHMLYTLKCLAAKKATLCEKPAAINLNQTQKMIDAAKVNQIFFMEGLWTKCFPIIKDIKPTIQKYNLGDIQNVSVKFG